MHEILHQFAVCVIVQKTPFSPAHIPPSHKFWDNFENDLLYSRTGWWIPPDYLCYCQYPHKFRSLSQTTLLSQKTWICTQNKRTWNFISNWAVGFHSVGDRVKPEHNINQTESCPITNNLKYCSIANTFISNNDFQNKPVCLSNFLLSLNEPPFLEFDMMITSCTSARCSTF